MQHKVVIVSKATEVDHLRFIYEFLKIKRRVFWSSSSSAASLSCVLLRSVSFLSQAIAIINRCHFLLTENMFIVCSWCPRQGNAKNKKRVTRTAINRWLAAFSCTSTAQSHGIITETLRSADEAASIRGFLIRSHLRGFFLPATDTSATAATKEKRKALRSMPH